MPLCISFIIIVAGVLLFGRLQVVNIGTLFSDVRAGYQWGGESFLLICGVFPSVVVLFVYYYYLLFIFISCVLGS